MSTDPTEPDKMIALAATALDDDGFRNRLKTNPESELANAGLSVPSGVTIEVLQNTPSKLYIVLPSQQPPADASDANKTHVFYLLNRWPI